jgi:hypothetical protein
MGPEPKRARGVNRAPSAIEPTPTQLLGGLASGAKELQRQASALATYDVHAELHKTQMAKETIRWITGKTISGEI